MTSAQVAPPVRRTMFVFSQRVVEKKRIPSESVNDTIGNGIQREMGAVLFLRVFQMHACVVSASSSKPGQQ
jgi:hypothetical protein